VACLLLNFQEVKGQDRVLDSLKRELENYKKEDTTKVHLLLNIVYEERKFKQFDNAQKNLDKSKILLNSIYPQSKDTGYYIWLGNIYYAQNFIYRSLNLRDSAYNTLNQAINFWQKADFDKGLGQGYNYLATLKDEDGVFEESIECYKKALFHYEKSKFFRGQIQSSYNLARLYTKIGLIEKSIANHYKNMKLADEIGYKEALRANYLSLGNIYKEQKEYRYAIYYYTKFYDISKDTISLIRAVGSLGGVYAQQKKYDSAIFFLDKETVLCKAYKDDDLSFVNLISYCRLHTDKKQFKEALSYAEQAMKLANISNNSKKVQQIKNLFGYIYQQKGECNKAIIIYQENLAFYTKANDKFVIKDLFQTLSECYEDLGRHREAIKYFRSYVLLRDSLVGEEKNRFAKYADAEYETSKKELEIQKQKLKITQKELEIQQLKAKELEQSQAQQQQLFIFTALIVGLVVAVGFWYYHNQQQTKFVLQTKETEKVQAELEAVTQDRADLSRQIHDRVLSPIKGLQIKHPEMATDVEKVYEQVQLFSHRLAAYDTELITARLYEYVAMYANAFVVKPSFTGNEALMRQIPPKIATELCIIADIAMLNAYQHAQATEVYLNFDCNSQQIMLSVSDNGIGFDKQKIQASTGRGLKNMQNRADQIKAKLEIESDTNEGLGTKIRLTLKM
jgi:signal transduction histidine kinase